MKGLLPWKRRLAGQNQRKGEKKSQKKKEQQERQKMRCIKTDEQTGDTHHDGFRRSLAKLEHEVNGWERLNWSHHAAGGLNSLGNALELKRPVCHRIYQFWIKKDFEIFKNKGILRIFQRYGSFNSSKLTRSKGRKWARQVGDLTLI